MKVKVSISAKRSNLKRDLKNISSGIKALNQYFAMILKDQE